MTFSVGFIGAGNMSSALLGGLMAKGWSSQRLSVADPEASVRARHAERGIYVTAHNEEILERADVVVLAVKPQRVAEVLEPLASCWQAQQPLLLSVVAGLSTQALQKWLGQGLKVVRAMPNTPALVQTGATAYYCPDQLEEPWRKRAHEILAAVGLVLKVDQENQLDIVTALSGSGPAYFFYVMESMQQAAEQMGLDSRVARALTLQTALGAAQMAVTSADSLVELRQKVTSPGGTTEAALQVFATQHLGEILATAMQAAKTRASELGELFAGGVNA